MAENLIDAGPPNAKRPKMTAPASDGPGNANQNDLNVYCKKTLLSVFRLVHTHHYTLNGPEMP